MEATRAFARLLWHRLEAIHAVTYFAPEARAATKAVGLRGFWMGYFGARAAPMGPVSAATVEATFYNFHPRMVRRAVPDAWAFAAPERILAARLEAATEALRRVAGESLGSADDALPLLRAAIDQGATGGRPLFAANRALPWPDHPVAALWHAATCLREHRGDGHVATLTVEGVDGCEAHVLFAASEGTTSSILRDNRGWSDDEWATAEDRLERRGLLSPEGITPAGRTLRAHIETRTDDLAAAPFRELGPTREQRLVDGLGAVATAVLDAGIIPFPNPIGLPRLV